MHQPVVLVLKLPTDSRETNDTDNNKAVITNNELTELIDDTTYSISANKTYSVSDHREGQSTHTESDTASYTEDNIHCDNRSQATTDNISESWSELEFDDQSTQNQTDSVNENHKTDKQISVDSELSCPTQKEDNSSQIVKTDSKNSLSTEDSDQQQNAACVMSENENDKLLGNNSLRHTAPAALNWSSADESDEEPRLKLPDPYTRRHSTDLLLEEARQAYAEQSLTYFRVITDSRATDNIELSSPLPTEFSDSSSDTDTDVSRSSLSGYDFSEQTEDSEPRLLIPKLYDKLEKIEIMEIRRTTPEGVLEKVSDEWNKSHVDNSTTVPERLPSFIAHT